MANQEIEWNEKLKSVWDKLFLSLDYDIYKTLSERKKYFENSIKNNSSLTENEKNFLINNIQDIYDAYNINYDCGENQQCNNCQNWG
jgi:hypothetical protein